MDENELEVKNDDNAKDKKPWYKNKKDLIFYGILISIVLSFFLVQKYIVYFPRVSGESMMNTMEDGDFFVCKRVYNIEEIERFDIVTVKSKMGMQVVKRVIGLPGETVFISKEGLIYINGKLLEENYGKEIIEDAGAGAYAMELRQDEFFLLGDNRNNSIDSRFAEVGLVKFEDFLGKAILYKDHSKE